MSSPLLNIVALEMRMGEVYHPAKPDGATDHAEVYAGYVPDVVLAEWLLPYGTTEERAHAIGLGRVAHARNVLYRFRVSAQTYGSTIAVVRLEDGRLDLAIVPYVPSPVFIDTSFIMAPADSVGRHGTPR